MGSLTTAEEFATGGEILLLKVDVAVAVACPVTMPVVEWGRVGVGCRFWCLLGGNNTPPERDRGAWIGRVPRKKGSDWFCIGYLP